MGHGHDTAKIVRVSRHNMDILYEQNMTLSTHNTDKRDATPARRNTA